MQPAAASHPVSDPVSMAKPASMPATVAQLARLHAGETIMRRKDRGIWKAITWAELADQVSLLGRALLAHEIGHGDVAAIISETRPEAVYADLAIQGTGAASIMIHPDEAPERIGHMLHSSGCRLVFVETEEQLDKVLTVRDRCHALSRIVILDMKGLREFSDLSCLSIAQFVAAAPGSASDWDASVNGLLADQPAIILFPREVVNSVGRAVSHGEVLQMMGGTGALLSLRHSDERLAVLRMADVTERVWGLYLALTARCISNYLESPETAVENLQELQPTVLGADAEAWAHLHERTTRLVKVATPVQRVIYGWALRAGRTGGVGAALANLFVLHAVRRELGLRRLRLAYVAGMVSPATQDWARCLGIAILNIDDPAQAGSQPDAQYRALMQDAHA